MTRFKKKITEDSVNKQEKLLLLRFYKNKTNNYEKNGKQN